MLIVFPFSVVSKGAALVWFGFLWYINSCTLFNAKSCLYAYYMTCKHILYITFLNEPELFFAHS